MNNTSILFRYMCNFLQLFMFVLQPLFRRPQSSLCCCGWSAGAGNHQGELTHCSLVMSLATEIWFNIHSGNGLLPAGTKPLPAPVLTHQWDSVRFIWRQFHRKCLTRYRSIKLDPFILNNQCFWWPCHRRSQVISSNFIDLVCTE